MSPGAIRRRLHAGPFQPFRLDVSGGSHREVRHREMTYVGLRTVMIAKRLAEDDPPDESVDCDPLPITRIEPRNGASSRTDTNTHG